MRLTEISARPGRYLTLLDLDGAKPFSLLGMKDCQVHRGMFVLLPASAENVTVGLTNNLLDRCDLGVHRSGGAVSTPLKVDLYNNLHVGGYLLLTYSSAGPHVWTVRDNLFDKPSQVLAGAVWTTHISRSHNAYTAGSVNNLGGTPVNTGLSRDFQAGPLGPYYYPLSGASPSLACLADAGSRTAGDAGLFHHTVRVDQAKDAGTVAIGFHYLAADPAEMEIAKSGMTLSASSAFTGWEAAKAKDGLLTDPGWCGTTFTGTSEYLRVNLNGNRTVSRVAYAPRAMSANWVDGTHNGVFRKYAIYVTDNASGTPANWGPPVATGEWTWPQLQERREVSFEPTVGQYVYFRRITAWGWYSAQDPAYAAQGYPGFANVNEIWLSELLRDAALGTDADGDGLADYIEDANEDGLVDLGETDATKWDSNDDGVIDFDTSPVVLLPSVMKYSCAIRRDFTSVDRDRERPHVRIDGFYMRDSVGYITYRGDYFGCVDTPGRLRIDEWSWESTGLTEQWSWDSNDGVSSGWVQGPSSPRPPFVWPYERCSSQWSFGMPASSLSGNYSREAATRVTVNLGSGWCKPRRRVVLDVEARDKSSGASLSMPLQGLWLYEPNTAYAFSGPIIDPLFTRIVVQGREVGPDGRVCLELGLGRNTDVTPEIENVPWYAFWMSGITVPLRVMTWSRHPGTGSVDVQAAFDEAAQILADDDDLPHRDSEPGLDTEHDDVNTYLDFLIPQATRATFPSAYTIPAPAGGTIVEDFTQQKYRNVGTVADEWILRAHARWANIKLVDSIEFEVDGGTLVTFGVIGPGPSIVFDANRLCGFLAAHEYGHLAGLQHRPNESGLPWADRKAIMFPGDLEGTMVGTEVNRTEKQAFEAYGPGRPWNE